MKHEGERKALHFWAALLNLAAAISWVCAGAAWLGAVLATGIALLTGENAWTVLPWLVWLGAELWLAKTLGDLAALAVDDAALGEPEKKRSKDYEN